MLRVVGILLMLVIADRVANGGAIQIAVFEQAVHLGKKADQQFSHWAEAMGR